MFPFTEPINLNQLHSASAEQIISILGPLLTSDRCQKIERVVKQRCFSFVPVLENIYDRGNVSAVIRSAEAFGFGLIHNIETSEKFKESQRTTAGSDKWVELQRWKTTTSCLQELKRQGKRIVATHLSDKSKDISEIDFSVPVALVLGNEKDGISKEVIDSADEHIRIPMLGFVQSFNISVAAALCFYHAFFDRKQKLQQSGDLSESEIRILRAIYYLRTLDSGVDILVDKLYR